METTELLCVGNVIVDVFIDIDSSLASKYGIDNPVQHIDREVIDQILHDPGCHFTEGECDIGFFSAQKDVKPLCASGGGAANVAKIAAMLGMKTRFAGCAGQDDLADFFKNELTGAGAEIILSKSGLQTGICLICNIGGVTRIAASPSAALEFCETDIDEELISQAEVIVLDGYILERRPLVQHILNIASRRGIPAALDAASIFQVRTRACDILQYSRNYPLFIFMNADEAIGFFNVIRNGKDEDRNLNEREKENIILHDVCPMLKIITDGEIYPIIVIKLGGRGAIVVAGGNIYHEETLKIIPRSAIGAGDAFCAAFIAAWIRGNSLSNCASLGNKVARAKLEVPGTGIKSGKLASFAKSLKRK
jgi:sugar/nucleoside kinase (ribokinase family)